MEKKVFEARKLIVVALSTITHCVEVLWHRLMLLLIYCLDSGNS